MFLGIDLGTTNTIVAIGEETIYGASEVKIIETQQRYNENWERFSTIPSVVYFDENGSTYAGHESKRLRLLNRERVIENSKRFMGTDKTWVIDSRSYRAKDVAAIILQHCKKNVDKSNYRKYKSVVITVPASFTAAQSQDTVDAAIQAGFEESSIRLIHEPTAALLSYIHEEAKKLPENRSADFSSQKRVLVFDLGGGTCDVSIIDLRVSDMEMYFKEIGIGRYEELGGIDFDQKVASALLNKFFVENKIVENTISKKEQSSMYSKLLLGSEIIKERLSNQINDMLMYDEYDEKKAVRDYNIPEFYNKKPLKISMHKNMYDMYTNSLYVDTGKEYRNFEDLDAAKNIVTIIRKTLEDHAISADSIDYVFLTGGMSQYISVSQRIEHYFNKPIIRPDNSMEAVAKGAAIYNLYSIKEDSYDGPQKHKATAGTPRASITDYRVLAEAILIEVNEGLPKVIIPKNQSIPYSGILQGAFYTTSPAGVVINLYAAEDEFDSSMRTQRYFEKKFPKPIKVGTPFDIEYHINENKIITMNIIINDGKENNIFPVKFNSDIETQYVDYNLQIDD